MTSPCSGCSVASSRLRAYSTQLGAVDVQTITQVFRQDVLNRGVQTTAVSNNYAYPFLHCIGDSQTVGLGVTTPFCSELSLTNQPTYTINNWGVSSLQLKAMTASDQFRVGPFCSTNLGTPSVANIFGGTNDWSQNGAGTSAAFAKTLFQNLAGEIQTLKRAGCIVFVSTMLSRYGTDPAGNSYDADKDAYNLLIRQGAVAPGAAGITDWNDPHIQADGAATSGASTYFQAGGLHLTQAGTDIQAALMSNALNYYFGTTPGNPTRPTATYSMLAGDRFLSTSSITGAATLTLPDCLGTTGAVYTISNPQSAYAVTVKNLSSAEKINGTDYSSAGYTFPSNSTHTFTNVALPATTAGCTWSMQ